MMVIMNIVIPWNVALCKLVIRHPRFRETGWCIGRNQLVYLHENKVSLDTRNGRYSSQTE
jgi:hypothetical protein